MHKETKESVAWLIKLPAAAQLLGMATPTVRRYAKANRLPGCVRIGGRYVVNLEILNDHLAGRRAAEA